MNNEPSANEQATPAAVSATKPAHTPSAGAMRAARTLAVSKPMIDAIHTGVGQYAIAHIIDRETAHAELVAALELAKPCIEYAEIATGATGWQNIQHKKCLEALEAVSAALAKAQS